MAVVTITKYEQILLVVEAREGYLYNDFGGGNPAMCGIHSLRQCDRRICFDGMLRVKNQNAPLSVKKIWSESLEELLEHLRAHGKLFQYCRTGSIASPESTTPVRMTTANPSRHERNSVTTESEAFDVAWNDKECCLEVWSTDRLTFEPKGSLLELRNRVAHGVSGLVAGPNQYLVGTFISDAMDPVDTENVLYYNVGSANFNQASLNGISWCRSFEAAPRAPGNRSSLHYHRYELAPLAQEPAGSTEAVATWSGVRMPEMSSGMKPGPIWWDMKKADIAWSGDQVSGAFEMRLTLHAPAGDRTPAIESERKKAAQLARPFHFERPFFFERAFSSSGLFLRKSGSLQSQQTAHGARCATRIIVRRRADCRPTTCPNDGPARLRTKPSGLRAACQARRARRR